MQKRTVLITGAGSGIGQQLSQVLAAEGHRIIATDLVSDAAQRTAQLIQAEGGDVLALALDVSRQADIDALRAQLQSERVDVLVNNAGLQQVAPLESFPPERFDLLVQVMLNGAAMLTRALLPAMRAQGYGRIVNIGSIHALVASPYKSAYVAAKHGLLGFSKVVALETADTDITINTICPSYVRTPLVDRQIRDQAREHGISEADVVSDIMLKPMPKGVFISVEELAQLTLFLMSPAARNITAQAIAVDGGWTAR
ncbi:3-hydroxybutyrate dehydrogenase [Marinobacterium rhizophilum]|uniref:3-hydroxybutyrate dehydrogenase n=1 Tax=Marinobacterium rhizophilum TaxID=420402 RepID=A0ABY5HHJ1_9GAMM|nr:3-hydroxybutyrate dehydrogenase [Marinobacterium rhizophilum]UTW11302.1 3-hydroxybutyrate dehydrogenase [Marinobacterium rhizophilum]